MIDFDKISKQLDEINVKYDKDKLIKIDIFATSLVEANKKFNLTSITDEEGIRSKHIVDSLLINKFYSFKDDIEIVDIGTGAGFPGIPIKIMYENAKILLVDSIEKRINFLNEIISQLNLCEINTLHSRAETLGRDKKHREKYDLCVSRAVAQMRVLSEFTMPLVKKGGKFVAYKGKNYKEELTEAENAINLLGGNFKNGIKTFSSTIPETDEIRNFIIVEKLNDTPDKFPRREGVPIKRPL